MIQFLNKDHKGHPKVVNCCQIYDLNRSSLPSESLDSDPKDGDILVIPSFLTRNNTWIQDYFFYISNSLQLIITPLGLNWKQLTTGRQVVVKTPGYSFIIVSFIRYINDIYHNFVFYVV